MPSSRTLADWLTYLNMAGDVVVILALAWRRLAGVYRLLFLYFLADLLQSALVVSLAEPFPFGIYFGGQAVKWILSFWFVLNLYGRVLAPHPALAKFGRATVGILLAIAVAASLPSFFLELYRPYDLDKTLFLFNRFERTADSANAIFLILMSVFLIWYPVKVRSNVASYLAGFTIYFLARAVGLTGMDWWRIYYYQIESALLVVAFGCMMFWAITMRPEGETRMVSGHHWNPEEAERLRRQLDEMNEKLERFLH